MAQIYLQDNGQGSKIKPIVSVVYTTFNHEAYVDSALKSFIEQETNFQYEIIIHDDCSTDGTAAIIQTYEQRYPQKIHAIYQKENQWSKGKYPAFYFALLVARGKYIAFCDGDDKWLSPIKLQRQVCAMKNFAVDMCGHPAIIITEDGKKLDRTAGQIVESPQHITAKKLIKKNSNMLPKSSIMISERVKLDLIENIPPVKFHTGLQLIGARRTGFCVLPEPMAAYRANVPDSATKILLGSTAKQASTAEKKLKSLNRIYELYDQDTRRYLRPMMATQLAYLLAMGWHEAKKQLTMLEALSRREKIMVFSVSLIKCVLLQATISLRRTKKFLLKSQ